MVRRRPCAVSNHEENSCLHPSRRGEDAAPQDEEKCRAISIQNKPALIIVEQHPADRSKTDDDRRRDRPSANADGADGLPRTFILGDLAVAQFVFLVRVVHRPALPVSVKLARFAFSTRRLTHIAAVVDGRLD